MKTGYVDLGRRFIPFEDTGDSDEAAWLSYYRPNYLGWRALKWDDLVSESSRCVVVLGEAGSGKTWEFEAQAELLNSRGVLAFFLPLEGLVDGDVERCLNQSDADRLKTWLEGSGRAVFFLDSLDEARLTSRNALREALSAIDRRLGKSLGRACIVVSCRVSEWRPRSDLELLKDVFGEPDYEQRELSVLSHKRESVRFRVVQLSPLDREQLAAMARMRGLDPPDDFVREVDRREAWIFAGRPGDAEELIGYWKRHQRLGSRSELIEEDVVRKLRERRNTDDVLESERARLGAERLGAAALLCRTSTFLVPDPSGTSGKGPSIELSDVLPDFSLHEQGALLGRAIFDEATYGRVRFHHRTVREYLAASWLQQLLKHGFRPEVEDLLFHHKYGRWFMPPSLVPVGGWLACSDAEIRRRLLEAEPFAIVEHADPERLDPVERSSMLEKLCDACAKRLPFFIDGASLRRFAHPCFASKINELLRKKDLPEHSKYFLLLLVWNGQIRGCSDEALMIVTIRTKMSKSELSRGELWKPPVMTMS